ncbi:isochorismatase family protein [Francisella sp. 19X1-34]|uniref:isochorismatase family protein n=1 Tax=Francisella sp. 19X1-34 TaxID=3087177 RepID=UPI002E348467|nr:isochorismatase family protein [Francisella sp. 19X1-34]MED7789302.1 isochorismatase family protein [Francisella sp. 19X1-34]
MSKLLIIVDMQKGFDYINPNSLAKTFNNISKTFDDVCFAMFENQLESLFETKLKWKDFQNEEDKSLINDIDVPEKAKFIWHSTYTVYTKELKELISKLNNPEIYIAGLFSNVCLIKLAMDMFDDGIVPYIIKDLSRSNSTDGVHDVAFATMKMAIGPDRIITTKEII